MSEIDLSLRYKYFHCANGLQMPDNSGWCSITMSPCSECSDNYLPGRAKIYKLKPREVVVEQKVQKVKVKEIKSKALPKIKKRKAPPGQTRLF